MFSRPRFWCSRTGRELTPPQGATPVLSSLRGTNHLGRTRRGRLASESYTVRRITVCGCNVTEFGCSQTPFDPIAAQCTPEASTEA
jgi:hypothetical protein